MEVLELDPPQLGVAEAGIFVADDDGTTILAGPFQHETEALAWIEKTRAPQCAGISLRSARVTEADALTKLCLRSKAVWGYSGDFMRACRNELSLTPDDIRASHVQVAASKDQILGVAQITLKGSVAELDKLFVDPAVLRSGTGRMLFEWARKTAHEAGATVLRMDADPDAAGFYRRMGAVDDGMVPSGSIPGRVIPRLKIDLISAAM